MNRRIAEGLVQRNSSLKVVAGPEAVSLLNEKDLADDWARFLENYVTSGVPDANSLSRIGQALGVDAIIQGEMVEVLQEDGRFGRNEGTTRVTLRLTMLAVEDGRLLWEASSDGLRKTASAAEDAPPVIEAVLLAVDKIVENLPELR
jgi:hypothetical protein